MTKNIPKKLLDATLKDTIFTDQYGAGLNKQVQQLLINTENEIAATIAKNDPTAPSMTKWKAQRLEKLQNQISDIVKTGYKDISSLTNGELNILAKVQAKNVVNKFNGAVGADLFQVTLTPDNVKSIVQNTLIDGQVIGDWWKKQSVDTQQRLSSAMAAGTQALQIGLVQAETVGDLIGRIRGTALTPGVMSISKREATSLVRTSVMQVANATRQETYKANADVLDGFEFIATLDERTCPRCAPYDGKKYDMNMQPIGHSLPFPGTPVHWQCRCTTCPSTKSWAALAGANSSLSKKQITSLNNIPISERASMNGPIGGNITYDGWLKSQSINTQKEVLGPGKYKLWAENKLDSIDLVNNNGMPLTIKELQIKLGDTDFITKQAEAIAAKEKEDLIAAINDPEKIVKFAPGQVLPADLYKPIEGAVPELKEGVKAVYGDLKYEVDSDLVMPMEKIAGLKQSTGMIVIDEETGKIWLNAPTNQFGGYKNTFPKGTIDFTGSGIQEQAIREVFEETGLQAKPIYHLGDYQKTTSNTRYFVGVKTGGSPAMMGWESEAVNLVPINKMDDLLNMAIDKKIAQDFILEYNEAFKLGKGDFQIGFKLLTKDKVAVQLIDDLKVVNSDLFAIAEKKLAAIPNLSELGTNTRYQYLKYEMDNAAAVDVAKWTEEVGTVGHKALMQTKYVDDPLQFHVNISKQVEVLNKQAMTDLVELTSTADGYKALMNLSQDGVINKNTDLLLKIKAIQKEKEVLFTKYDEFIASIKPGSLESEILKDGIPEIGKIETQAFKMLGADGKIKAIQQEAQLLNNSAKGYLAAEKKVAPNVFSTLQKQVSNWDDLTPWEQRIYYDGDLGKEIKFSLEEIDKLLKMPEGQSVWAESNQSILATWKPQDVKTYLEDQIMKTASAEGGINGKLVADLTSVEKLHLEKIDDFLLNSEEYPKGWSTLKNKDVKGKLTGTWNSLDSSVKQQYLQKWSAAGISPPSELMGSVEKKLWAALDDLPKNVGSLNGKVLSDLNIEDRAWLKKVDTFVSNPPLGWKPSIDFQTELWNTFDTSLKQQYLTKWKEAGVKIPESLLGNTEKTLLKEVAPSRYKITTSVELGKIPNNSINNMDDFYALKIDPALIQKDSYIGSKFTKQFYTILKAEKETTDMSFGEFYTKKFGVPQPIKAEYTIKGEAKALDFIDEGIKKKWLDLNQVDLVDTTGYTKEELLDVWNKQTIAAKGRYIDGWAQAGVKIPDELLLKVNDLISQMGIGATQEAIGGKIATLGKTTYNLEIAEDAAKFKTNMSTQVSKYTKSVAAGQTPSQTQLQAYNLLDSEAQAKVNQKIGKLAGESIKPVSTQVKPVISAVETKVELNFDDMVKYGSQEGSNTGGFYNNINNPAERYYIKVPANEEIVRNEMLAGKLYQAAGVEVPELQLINVKGEKGIASRIVDGLKKDPDLLKSGTMRAGIYDDFVVDAWLGDWDVVGLGYDNLQIKDGVRALRIDVGGSLRFRAQGAAKGSQFGNKVLELSSMRDGRTNSQAASVFKKITQSELDAGARKVLTVSDSKIKQLVNEFGPLNKVERDQLVDTLIARKKYIQEQFPHIKIEEVVAPVKDIAGKIAPFEQQAIETSRIQGYVIKVDKEGIEDHQLLMWIEKDKAGNPITAAQFKLHGDAISKMDQMVSQSVKGAVPIYDTTELHASILDSFRGIAMQARNNEVLRAKDIERATAAITKYKNDVIMLRDKGLYVSKDIEALQNYYDPWINRLKEVVKLGEGKQYVMADANTFKNDLTQIANLKQIVKKEKENIQQIVFTKSDGSMLEKKIVNGYATRTGKIIRSIDQYVETEVDGVKIQYWPNNSDINFAHRGLVRVETMGNQLVDSERILDVLENQFKVNVARTTVQDQELMYLKQIAYARNDQVGRNWLVNVTTKGEVEKQIKYLQTQISKKAGFDITKTDLYKIDGETTAFGVGKVNLYRPDLAGPEWDKFRQDYKLHHHLNSGGAESAKRILQSGGDLTSTVDKFRKGFDWGGMSPSSDMESGGANYLFARIKSTNSAYSRDSGLVWKSDLMARTDAISYDGDLYGRVTEGAVQSHRKGSITGWKSNASNSNNETIFKQTLSIFDKNFDRWICESESERQSIIKVFRENNYRTWPDGRKLEDVIVTN